jgi:hypothetical protein
MPCDILGVWRASSRFSGAGSLAHRPDASLGAVEIEPEFSCVEGADGIADGVERRRGVGLVHPVHDDPGLRAWPLGASLLATRWPGMLAAFTCCVPGDVFL